MTLVFDAPVHPDSATVFAREVPLPADHKLVNFLPDVLVQEQTVRLVNATRVNRTASFRSFDGNIPQLERDYVDTREVDLLPISVQGMKGELERLQLERARQKGGSLAAITTAIYDDITLAVRAIRNRIEVARGELLHSGKIQLNGENGLYLNADFGVPADHFVTAAKPWSDPAATIVSDLAAWVDKYTQDTGYAPGGMIISRKTASLLQRNAEFRTYAASLAGTPQLVSRSMVNNILDDFNLPAIAEVYDTVIRVDGVDKRVIPEGKVIFVPPTNTLGSVKWGITATALELVNAAQSDMSFADAPGLTGVVVKSGPPFKETTVVDALCLPVLEDPKALFVATIG
ncbi:major capsid protein [Nocardia pseudobrasiliensis]|uniref:Major capsid protein E n=1 Tax=Nocardia pseudobrasiliensis TaxID=45979 RepID=A0A370I8N4_9NOCA|nr:major capsid protein [Nocardia pseudobrasiliensis]RDI65754.1 major capsid protein E [Nocardia pseudobrasiliensis]